MIRILQENDLAHNQCSTIRFHILSIDSGDLVWRKLKIHGILDTNFQGLKIVVQIQWP